LRKFIFLSLLALTSLEARENPFFPVGGEKEIMFSSNLDSSLPPLKRAAISLPTSARVIESVTVAYKNLDGSVEEKSIVLQNTIDWHLPIFISQSYLQNQETDIQKKQKTNYKEIASIKHAKFLSSGKNLKIITEDTIERDFLLVKPHRIVLDFKKDTNLKSYVKSNPKSIFKKIRIGNHSGYYRVVIELDGYYRYKFKSTKNGYEFKLQ